MTIDALEILRCAFPDMLPFRSLIYNRFIELNWWFGRNLWAWSAGRTKRYVFVMAGPIEFYVGRL